MRLTPLSAQLPRAQEEAAKIRQFVSFRIGREDFGVDVLMIQEIIRMATITPIPNASEAILGMINLRGKIIPIVDLKWYLRVPDAGREDNDRKARILIIELSGHVIGFIVDSVSEVMKVALNEIEPAPNLVTSSISAAYISGVLKYPSRLVILLDFQQILRPGDQQELEAIGSQGAGSPFEPVSQEADIRLSVPSKAN